MDFSTIAKRTRSRDPEYYRWLHEKLRNERDRNSANGDGQASSSEARSGNSAGQSLGGGRSSTDPSRGGGGRSTGPSTSHNVLDYEDEEEEQRMLKKQRPIISNKMTQKKKGRQRKEAERTIRELERATQEAERKKEEEEEAHKKILEWRPMREAISMKADASDPKGKAKMNFEGSCNTKDKIMVHIDDEETEPDASSEDYDIDIIALSKQQKAKAKVKVEAKEERILITDLKQEVEETVAAQRSSKKNIITEPAHQALDDDSDDNIAFSENQNASADVEVEEQETFVGLEDVVEVELKSSNSNIVGESAHQAYGHDSEDGFALPIKQNSSVDIEVQVRRSSVDLEEVHIVAEKPSTTKRVGVKEERIYIIDLEQEVEETVAAEKSIVIEPTHQALGDDSDDGIAFSENQNASAVDEQRTFVSLENVVEVESITAKKSSSSDIVGESAH
ncbi:DEAD-box ATP-dependent RNA helicase 42-like [Papaver somniferum]|nr:DEAD-box ATP-dependent RNA helicase 42-like [Papaver somniferum]